MYKQLHVTHAPNVATTNQKGQTSVSGDTNHGFIQQLYKHLDVLGSYAVNNLAVVKHQFGYHGNCASANNALATHHIGITTTKYVHQ